MAVNGIMVCVLVAALLVHGLASASQSPADGDSREGGILQQLLASRGKIKNGKDSVARPNLTSQNRMTRMERLAHLSEDERDSLTRQIMQTITEIVNSGCMSDRDYQGWVDFGRRSTE